MLIDRIIKFKGIDLFVDSENYVVKTEPPFVKYYGITVLNPIVGKKLKSFNCLAIKSTSKRPILSITKMS